MVRLPTCPDCDSVPRAGLHKKIAGQSLFVLSGHYYRQAGNAFADQGEDRC
jgi:hypothetical protein